MPRTRPHGVRRTVSALTAGALTLALAPALTASAQAPTPEARSIDLACPDDATSTFPDIAGSVHADAIRCLADLQVVQGKVDGRYDPRDTVKRDQMATFVVNAVEQYTGEELPGGDVDRFPDVDATNVHREAINKLRASGWIQGRTDGTYGPRDDVRRGQMARFITGALSFLDDGDGTNASAPPVVVGGPLFPDTLGSPFADDIDRIAAQGIVQGYRDGNYGPVDPVFRDQMASFIARTLDYAIDANLGRDLPPGFVETSRFVTEVDALQVTNGSDFRLGEPDATGVFDLRLDSVNNTVCYDITLDGVSGNYQSPALTATHIHANVFGSPGPAVVAFENPTPVDSNDLDGVRRSSGCVDGDAPSFPDGAMNPDPGAGFDVALLEANPQDYYLDSHTTAFPAGAVRGQLGSTDVYDVSLSWHDEVDDSGDTPLFGVGEPGADGDALLVVTDATDPASGTAVDRMCAALATDATGPFAGSPGAHLHEGARDANGPVVVGFETPDDDTGSSISCSAEFLEGFTPADLSDDLENYYVNLHSEAFPAGAVRGQLPFGTRIDAGDVTSTWSIEADPDQVVGAGGEPDASATYELTFDSDAGVVCYDITTDGVSGDYSSPAVTANHIHEAPAGVAGPPRVAFANPVPVDEADPDGLRTSSGCAVTPQFTGTGGEVDNGLGATLADIEADPADYYVDVHTEEFVPGAVRGQFDDAFTVTSRWTIAADPDQVVNADGDPVDGEEGATGVWNLRMDAGSNLICYAIELDGVSGAYSSPAATATHIHANVAGQQGPPVVAFANPVPVDDAEPDAIRRSSGCVDATAPAFDDGRADDPGEAFTVAMLEADPDAYYVDTHTAMFEPGAVRGQFEAPIGADAAPASTSSVAPASSPADFTVPTAGVGQVTEAPEGFTVSEFGCHFEAI